MCLSLNTADIIEEMGAGVGGDGGDMGMEGAEGGIFWPGRVYSGLGQFIPRGINWPRPV